MFPVNDAVSWESHVMGSIAGIFLAFYFRKVPIYLGEKEHMATILKEEDETRDRVSNVSHTANTGIILHYFYRDKS